MPISAAVIGISNVASVGTHKPTHAELILSYASGHSNFPPYIINIKIIVLSVSNVYVCCQQYNLETYI